MRDAILVLTNSKDGRHSDIVISKLEQYGQRVFRFDSDRFTRAEIEIGFSTERGDSGFDMASAGGTVSSKEIKSVWYRRPNFLDLKIKNEVQRRYAQEEITNLLEGLWTSMPNVFWLSNPTSLHVARKKLYQLYLATEMGFMVPKTIVTNNPNKVREFYSQCGGKIVFKAIHGEVLDYREKPLNIPTTLITDQHLGSIDLVRRMPGLFQEFIEKDYELRVTVVGDKIFPIKVQPLVDISFAVDWRHPQLMDNLSYSLVELPERVSLFCLSLLEKLKLSFGAFDFVIGKDGNTYFLEINPNGQWYWLEDRTGILISDAITDILAKAPKERG